MPSTRHRLVEVAGRLFCRHGFHASSLEAILDEVGVSKTTFYKYFESKDELALECLRVRQANVEKFPELLRSRCGDDPIRQLREVFSVWQDWFDGEHFSGCIFLHACREFPAVDDDRHRLARENATAMQGVVHEIAVKAGASDPDLFAERFSLLMQGAITVEVVHRDSRAVHAARAMADLLIDEMIQPAQNAISA